MARFLYTAKASSQQNVRGFIDAQTQSEAVNKIMQMGYFPLSVREFALGPRAAEPASRVKIPSKDLVLFTRQLATLLDSGVTVVSSLNLIAKQTANKELASMLERVVDAIKEGKALSESLALYPKVFSNLYSSMIYSGEASGTLNETLARLADFLERGEELKNVVRSALIYPVFLLIVGVSTILTLILFVIPRLVTMFEDMGQVLPLPTKILISISGAFRTWWWLMIIAGVAAVFTFQRSLTTKAGRLAFDQFKLRVAVLGDVILKTDVSRLVRTLSLLLSGGLAIVTALEVTASVAENTALKNEVKKFREDIIGGGSLSESLRESRFFPEFVTNIVAIGEETGALPKALLRIADDYERDAYRRLNALTRMIEPVIILVIGLVVGFIVLSMLLPIFQINLMVK